MKDLFFSSSIVPQVPLNVLFSDATPDQIAVIDAHARTAFAAPSVHSQYHYDLSAALLAACLANPGDVIVTDCVGCLRLGKNPSFAIS